MRAASTSGVPNDMSISIFTPKGCLLSLFLYILHKKSSTSSSVNGSRFKYADTYLEGLISDAEYEFLREGNELGQWSENNCLTPNLSKMKEMIIEFQRHGKPLESGRISNVLCRTL